MSLATSGLHHIALVSGDLLRSASFYGEMLGLARVSEPAGAAAHEGMLFGAEGGDPGTLLQLTAGDPANRGRPGIGGVHHFALGVPTESALLRWKRRLTDTGASVTGPYDRGYFTSIYFRDPDQQVVEIATAGPGYAIDEDPAALGTGVMLPPRRIVRGARDESAIAALTHPEPVPEIGSDMRLTGLHHISGITDDLDRAGDFYEEVLGLRLVKRTVNRDDPSVPHWFWARYDGRSVAENSSYTLFGWRPEWNRARAGVGQARRVAFRAAQEGDLPRWRDHLEGKGVATEDVRREGRLVGLRFEAPDGQPLELTPDRLDPL